MKKVFGILVIFCLLLSCSKDHESIPPKVYIYEVVVNRVCNDGVFITRQISKETFNTIGGYLLSPPPCLKVRYKDIEGVEYYEFPTKVNAK